MRMVRRLETARCRDFGNCPRAQCGRDASQTRDYCVAKERDTSHGSPGFLATQKTLARNDKQLLVAYSRTLSSSFLRSQSAAAWTKARTTGCGFFAVEESWGWNRVAMKKRWVGDSMARISPCSPRATTGKPASMVAHSYSGLTSKLQKNSSVTSSLSFP